MTAIITAGIDIGSGCIKTVLFRVDGETVEWLDKDVARIRNRDPFLLTDETYDAMLARQGLCREDVAYVASTGDAEALRFATGHFYSMTTHGRGAVYLNDRARSVLDIGALNGRAIRIDDSGKVLGYRMTSQCASGSGQFLENIARYLGIAQDEIGQLSKSADAPEKVSSICAVLAETDVINMVSRGISAANILKGIHVSMATRLAKLLKAIGATEGVVQMTGGLALDEGLVAALNEALAAENMALTAQSHADAIHAGAIGAALWGAFRHQKLALLDEMAA
ncbi:benzoyl-CoA reductase subunit D [Rhodovulum euryhalinum]|uniref:Benzoyl-CoA reductase subunit D n=1 Tax=Rhodovulum euryhalinum TaxID=35805 RepID=A0A4R2KBE7_9RHOB|nr:benzoyl-CoA reductase subunit D [Rhodovulum euryhalinum]TCO70134.1 benzoyl-CoA reductase subunit D [Rhodovulum euryhalinum]